MHTLRQTFKQQRQQLSPEIQSQAALLVTHQLINSHFFKQSSTIAFYSAYRGELNPAPLLHYAWAQGKTVYLPILHPLNRHRLLFARYDEHTPLRKNRFNIVEPVFDSNQLIAPWLLDIVLMPVLAFDDECHRIGMGMGYYDRTFAFTKYFLHRPRPQLIGLAYEWQKIDSFTPKSWDVPLDLVVTETTQYKPTLDSFRYYSATRQ